MAAYIATDAGYAGARDLVAAAGLITVGADGTISVSFFRVFLLPDCTFPKKEKTRLESKAGRRLSFFFFFTYAEQRLDQVWQQKGGGQYWRNSNRKFQVHDKSIVSLLIRAFFSNLSSQNTPSKSYPTEGCWGRCCS